MEKFVFFEHTADVFFEAYGFSFEEAFRNAALAMFSVISKTESLSEEETVEVSEEAENMEDLVSFALSDLLSESDSRELFFSRIDVSEFSQEEGKFSLKCTAYGEPMSPEKGKTTVKAVTHHETNVEKEGNMWKIRILLDI